MTNTPAHKMKYKRRWFTKEEWEQLCNNERQFVYNHSHSFSPLTKQHQQQQNNNNKYGEPSIPLLLLNYFIVYGYEEAAIRLAKELNIISNNNDILSFNKLFMINERKQIKILIQSGKIMDSITLIDNLFGLESLNSNNNNNNQSNQMNSLNKQNDNSYTPPEEDLLFKLMLLNLIEMIRSNNNTTNTTNDNDDITKLIEYTRTHLAMKASHSIKYMNDLQSVISLLMLHSVAKKNNKSLKLNQLPLNLQKLYSIKLRNNLAHLINMKLLQLININVSNQSRFPNLILSNNSNILGGGNSLDNDYHNNSLKYILKNNPDQQKTKSRNESIEPKTYPSTSITDHNKYWQETKKYLNKGKNNITTTESTKHTDNSIFEANLVQLMKLWIYSENQLHRKDFGIPRVEDNLTQL